MELSTLLNVSRLIITDREGPCAEERQTTDCQEGQIIREKPFFNRWSHSVMESVGTRNEFIACAQRRGRIFLLFLLLALLAATSYILWQAPGFNTFLRPNEIIAQPEIPILTSYEPNETASNASYPSMTFLTEDFELEGPFDGSALAAVCEKTKWQEGLYFDCSNNSGGIGNMRNFILTCVRYAIDAGASLIKPTIRKRNENKLADLFTTYMPLSYMFDEAHFLDSLHEFCPQMKIVEK